MTETRRPANHRHAPAAADRRCLFAVGVNEAGVMRAVVMGASLLSVLLGCDACGAPSERSSSAEESPGVTAEGVAENASEDEGPPEDVAADPAAELAEADDGAPEEVATEAAIGAATDEEGAPEGRARISPEAQAEAEALMLEALGGEVIGGSDTASEGSTGSAASAPRVE